MTGQPAPPPSLPNYLAEGVPKQDRETLEALRGLIDELLAVREQPIDRDDLLAEARPVDETPSGSGTIVEERVKCGVDCTCNDGDGHGPYRYRYEWRDGQVRSEYLGKG